MLKNLIHDNTPIVDRMDSENIEYFFEWLIRVKNSDFLEFLGVLAVCEDRAMPRNQQLIMYYLIKKNEKKEITVSMKIQDNKVFCRDRGGSEWLPIAKFTENEQV